MTVRRRSAFDVQVDEPEIDPWEAAANTSRDVLEERGQDRVEMQTKALTLRNYADLLPEPRGPLDFRKFPWQLELYDQHAADDREQIGMKATQIGYSTVMIRGALFYADVRQWSVLYTFPTDDELNQFSRKRIKPVIRASPRIMDRMRGDGVDNVGQKQIGTDGWLFFRGTQKPIDSLDIDVAIFDEYDTSDQANIEASERRVSGPQSAGLIRRIGVPSIPGFGISALYEASDQRAWVVKCGACKTHNPMIGWEAFDANVDQDRSLLVCRKCRKAIDVRKGEWVAKHPDRDVRGYHAPKLLIPGPRTLGTVIANSKKTRDYQVTAFHTRDLGQPYAPAEGRLSLEQVQACVRPELRPIDPRGTYPTHAFRFMGIDMASTRALNVSIEEKVGTDPNDHTAVKLYVGEVEDDPALGSAFTQICQLIDRHQINMVCVDNNPDGRFGKALTARYPGRVYRVQFNDPSGQPKKAPVAMVVDDEEHFVSLHRTMGYDGTFDRFRQQRVLLPHLDLLPSGYAEQLGALYRQKTEDGAKVVVRYVATGDHDYAQAEAYCLCALEVFWRNVGLNLTVNAPAQPLADLDPYAAGDEEDELVGGGEPIYNPGFD